LHLASSALNFACVADSEPAHPASAAAVAARNKTRNILRHSVDLSWRLARLHGRSVLSALREEDPEWVARRAVFEQALQALGWSIGRDLRIDYRWTGIDPATIEKFAAD